jgi:hypothetical protein
MALIRVLVALVLGLAVTVDARAGGKPVRSAPAAVTMPPNIITGDVGTTVPAPIVKHQVDRLNGKIKWLTSLGEAQELAQKSNKPIFWVHVLGDIDGEC